jgi:hypothetical protein
VGAQWLNGHRGGLLLGESSLVETEATLLVSPVFGQEGQDNKEAIEQSRLRRVVRWAPSQISFDFRVSRYGMPPALGKLSRRNA